MPSRSAVDNAQSHRDEFLGWLAGSVSFSRPHPRTTEIQPNHCDAGESFQWSAYPLPPSSPPTSIALKARLMAHLRVTRNGFQTGGRSIFLPWPRTAVFFLLQRYSQSFELGGRTARSLDQRRADCISLEVTRNTVAEWPES